MLQTGMRLRRLGWIVYGRVGRPLRRWPIWRWPVVGKPLGERLDTMVRKTLPAPNREWSVTLWNGSNLLIPAHYQDFTLYEAGIYEADTTRVLRERLPVGAGFVDAGAHLGYFSLVASRLLGPSGRVYAFEPDPHHFSYLVRNLQANACANTTAIPLALADRTTELRFFSQPGASGGSLHRNAAKSRVIRVRTTTLDEFLAEEGWPPIAMIKMDIEGGELFALRGMRETIQRNSGLTLIMEYSPLPMQAAGVDPLQLLRTLQEVGFTRLFAIGAELELIRVPEDAGALLSKARRELYVNLLCTSGGDST